MGADCILLIAACLSDGEMEILAQHAMQLNMDILVEVHNAEELKRALKLPLIMIGINNRNLRTFDVSLQTTVDLLSELKDDILVITESGILSSDDVAFMHEHDVYSFWLGEAFMRQDDPGVALQEIFKGIRI
jgi:indole-3-glycerol phosphate synthase (EC 4.1.1.48)